MVDPAATAGRRYALPDLGHLDATAVSVRRGVEELVAVGRTLKATQNRSALYLFTIAGELLYHEVVEASSITLFAPAERPGVLFVGAGQTVWQYEFRQE